MATPLLYSLVEFDICYDLHVQLLVSFSLLLKAPLRFQRNGLASGPLSGLLLLSFKSCLTFIVTLLTRSPLTRIKLEEGIDLISLTITVNSRPGQFVISTLVI